MGVLNVCPACGRDVLDSESRAQPNETCWHLDCWFKMKTGPLRSHIDAHRGSSADTATGDSW